MASLKNANELLEKLPPLAAEYVKRYRQEHGPGRFKFEYIHHDRDAEGEPIDWSISLHIRRRKS